MARLVRAATDRNPPTLGWGGCQAVWVVLWRALQMAQNGTTHLHTAAATQGQGRAWTGPACGQYPRGQCVSMGLSLVIFSVVLLWPEPAQRAFCGLDRASCTACSSRGDFYWHAVAEARRNSHSTAEGEASPER